MLIDIRSCSLPACLPVSSSCSCRNYIIGFAVLNLNFNELQTYSYWDFCWALKKSIMPQTEGGYVSLGGEQINQSENATIYKSTTEPNAGPQSVFESMKRALGNVVGNNGNASSPQEQALLSSAKGLQPVIIGSR